MENNFILAIQLVIANSWMDDPRKENCEKDCFLFDMGTDCFTVEGYVTISGF